MDKIDKLVLSAARQYFDMPDATPQALSVRLKSEWGEGATRGYCFGNDGDGDGLEAVLKIDDLGVYDSDLDAAKQAKKDGVKLIPYEESYRGGESKHYRFLDTQDNRTKILAKKSQGIES